MRKSFLLIELILYIFFFAFVGIYIAFSAYSILNSVKKNYLISKFSEEYSYFLEEITNWALQGRDFYTGNKYELIFQKDNEKRGILCSGGFINLTNVYSGNSYSIDKVYEYINCDSLSGRVVKGGYWIKLNLIIGDEKMIELPYFFYNGFRM